MLKGMAITAETLAAASDVVYRHMQPTPQFAWPLLAQELGTEVWLKHEDGTPAGAFKVRGGLVFMERLRRERPHVTGVVSATRGNHGQSLAYAGREYGVPVAIVVPRGNSVEKNSAMLGFGAELIEHGDDFQEAKEYSAVLAAERGYEYTSSFQADLVAGVATYAKELFDAAGGLDAVYVPVGMGSGICALIGVRDLLGLQTEVIGVVSAAANAHSLSFAAKHVVSTESAHTFVDGVATRQPDPEAVAIMVAGASRFVEVSEDVTADAMRLIYRTTHHLPEPAGAIVLAALGQDLAMGVTAKGQRLCAVLSGGNMDTSMAAEVLSGRTPRP